jgi:outer membrane protein insertion porin family
MLLALAVIPLSPARAQSTRVTEIEIRGNQRINQETIRSAISTKPGDEASRERLERDRQNIDALGWFRAVTLQIQQVGDGVRVTFIVVEYPQVQDLQIAGSSIFSDEQLRALIKTKTGEVFNHVKWDEDLAAIGKLYADKGYLMRALDNTRQPPDPDFLEKGILRLEIHEVKVGKVTVKWPVREIKDKKGNVIRTETQHKTKEYVVRRELSQQPGALYNKQQLAKDYRALSGLGFFEAVNPSQTAGEEPDTVDLTWELTEKRTGQVSVGAGYSPRQQLIGRAELADQNLRGKGQSVSISGEIGTFGGDGAPSVELQFHEPWLTKSKTSLTVDVYDKLVYRFSRSLVGSDNDNNRYFERRLGGQLSFGRPFSLPVTAGLRFDRVDTGELPKKFDFPQQNGTVIAGNLTRVWNRRNYAQNPTSGSLIRVLGETGYAKLDHSNANSFSSAIFTKGIIDLRKYIPLKHIKATTEPEREQESQKVPVIAARAMVGHVFGDVPFFEQFFVGGSESLRGYLEDRFWGNSMYLGSVEYRRPIVNRIVGVLFADVGDAFDSQSEFRFNRRGLQTRFEQHQGIRPFASVGIGLRVATPIGPIRLDFGYGEEGGRTHFSIGHAF